MDKRIAQNIQNFLLSDRFTYKGNDTLAVLEAIRELQKVIGDGRTDNAQGGDTQAKTE